MAQQMLSYYHNSTHVKRPPLIPNTLGNPTKADAHPLLRPLKHFRKCAAVLLAEALVAAGVLTMVIVGASHALLTANRIAAASRVLTGARAVVQRNIDTALTVTFTQASQPAILAITTPTGQVYDDDGGFDNTIQIAVQDNGTAVVAAGVLTRTVTAVANADNADIRQITFRLDFTYKGRAETMSMSTMRSIDD